MDTCTTCHGAGYLDTNLLCGCMEDQFYRGYYAQEDEGPHESHSAPQKRRVTFAPHEAKRPCVGQGIDRKPTPIPHAR